MNPSHCKKIWADGGVAHMTLLHLNDPRVAEIAAGIGWDCIWLDMEHGPRTTRELELMNMAIRAGASRSDLPKPDVMARPAKGEFMRMGRLLEAGAHGILYPRCESADEAREVVRWAKFAPIGERGFDGANADNAFGTSYVAGDYTTQANEATWIAVQIESPSALPHAQAMAEVDGVDALFFGPGDYSCLLERPGQLMHAEVRTAAKQVADAAHNAGKVFATIGIGDDHRKAMLDLGCQLICCGADQGLLRQAMVTTLNSQRGDCNQA